MIANMAKQVKTYQEKQDILSVGVSVPGIVRKDGYMVTAGAISLLRYQLKEVCEAAFQLPVVVQNVTNAVRLLNNGLGMHRVFQTIS